MLNEIKTVLVKKSNAIVVTVCVCVRECARAINTKLMLSNRFGPISSTVLLQEIAWRGIDAKPFIETMVSYIIIVQPDKTHTSF